MGALRTRIEQVRQAKCIHGGLLSLCAVSLAVRVSRMPIPFRRLRMRVYRTIFGKKYEALNEAEADRPLWAYPSFNALFTRAVKPELRPISRHADQFICPCDGRIQEIGTIEDGKILTVKGVEYTVGSILAGADSSPFHGGRFAIVFLSPVDCHRIFSPQDGHIDEITHVPGYRLLVHPPYQKKEFPVFALNERVIFRMTTPLGPCALVMVAGWGVGNITFPRDLGFRCRRRRLKRAVFAPPLAVRRGDWIGTFELGSTAILLTGPGASASACVERDEKIKYGQPLFTGETAEKIEPGGGA
jgi:phosphatidylserine decarboxylase